MELALEREIKGRNNYLFSTPASPNHRCIKLLKLC
jgi:hypothetical protein